MHNVEWKNEYLLGIDTIDRQHRKIFSLVNLFFDTIEMSKSHLLVESLLRGIMTYIHKHICTEESLMAEIGFPHLADHQAKHQLLLSKAFQAIDTLNIDEKDSIKKMIDFFNCELIQHIQQEDRQYSAFMAGTGRPGRILRPTQPHNT